MKCVFITGGTGLLGVNIVKEFLQNTSDKIVLLIRNPIESKRAEFFQNLISFNGGFWECGIPYERVEIIDGDVTLPHLGIDPTIRERLLKEVDIIFHSAAVIKLSGAEAETQAVNVGGTKNVLNFALECKEKGRLDKVVHVSTIAVSGNAKGIYYETDLDVGQGFNNPYEKSKFGAEKIVEEYREKGLNILIVRPSMVIGDSETGFTNNFNIFYFQLRLLSQGILDVIPFHEEAAYNLVPVDYAAKAICLITNNQKLHNGNFHIVNPHEMSVEHFIEKVCGYLGYEKPELVSICKVCPLPETAFDGVRGKVLGIYYPYISCRKIFNASNTQKALRSYNFTWPRMDDSLLTRMLDFCILSGYLKLKAEVADTQAIGY